MITQLRKFVFVLLFAIGLGSCGTDDSGDNTPPELQVDVSQDIEWIAGEGIIRITATASDPDGDDVRIEMAQAPERSDFTSQGSWGVFTWDPLPSDVTPADEGPTRVVFAAVDSHGERTERVVSITVLASNGVPRFTSASSVLHNIGSADLVSFDVEVRDDDSGSVSIRMPIAPDGAELNKTGDFSGRFGWSPSAEQLAQRVHTVRFIADDGDHDPVEQNVTIIVKKPGTIDTPDPDDPNASECRFETFVEYEALGAQRGVENYEVRARLTAEGAERFQKIVLNYTDGDGFNDRDLEWNSIDMEPDGENFVGTIPNPLLEQGQSAEYYWELCAVDSESQGNQPVVCGPSSLYESFVAYAPESTECLDPRSHGESFFNAETIEDAWSYGRLCEGDEDYWELGIGTQQEAQFSVVYAIGSSPKIEVFDADQNLLSEPEASDCTGLTKFSVSNTEAPIRRFVRVSGEPDTTYQIVANVHDLTEDSECVDADLEPNDTVANAVVVESSTTFEELEICRPNDVDIFAVELDVGDRVTGTARFTSAIGDFDMSFFTPSQQDDVAPFGFAERYSLGVGDEESISYTATEAGTHWFVVYTVDNANRYSMEFEIETDVVVCMDDDQYEPNDSQSSADLVSEQLSYDDLKICPQGDDWYEFLVTDWTSENFEITLEPGPGATTDEFTLEVWDEFGLGATGSASDGKLRTLFFPLNNHDHFIRITSSKEATYSFKIKVNFSL